MREICVSLPQLPEKALSFAENAVLQMFQDNEWVQLTNYDFPSENKFIVNIHGSVKTFGEIIYVPKLNKNDARQTPEPTLRQQHNGSISNVENNVSSVEKTCLVNTW